MESTQTKFKKLDKNIRDREKVLEARIRKTIKEINEKTGKRANEQLQDYKKKNEQKFVILEGKLERQNEYVTYLRKKIG